MTIDTQTGNRLKHERERLKLTQTEFGKLVGAAKRTVIEWEKSVTSPNAVQLSAFAEAGVDVSYVLGISPARMLPRPLDYPALCVQLQVGERLYFETTLEKHSNATHELMESIALMASRGGMAFETSFFTAVASRKVGEIRYMLCVERTR